MRHPKWKMGKKISIDSATLMNKMLEVIEAHKLFSIELNKIDIVIHPESLVHAVIEFKNGLFKFIYHETTMLIPLANAIFGQDININDYLKRFRSDALKASTIVTIAKMVSNIAKHSLYCIKRKLAMSSRPMPPAPTIPITVDALKLYSQRYIVTSANCGITCGIMP